MLNTAAFAACLFFNVLCTGAIAVSNKSVLVEGFNPVHLLTLHYLLGYLSTLRCVGERGHNDGSKKIGRDRLRVLFLGLATVLNLLFSQLSLKNNPLIVYQIGRYLAIPLTAVGDVMFNGLQLSKQASIGLMLVLCGVCCLLVHTYQSTLEHGVKQKSINSLGLFLCVTGAVAQAGNAVGMNFILQHYDVTALELLQDLSFCSSVLFVGVCAFAAAGGVKLYFHKTIIPMLAISCVSAVVIQYTSLRITKDSSATFYTMMTIFKSATVALVGSIVLSESLQEVELTAFAVSSAGILLFRANNLWYKKIVGVVQAAIILSLVAVLLASLGITIKAKSHYGHVPG